MKNEKGFTKKEVEERIKQFEKKGSRAFDKSNTNDIGKMGASQYISQGESNGYYEASKYLRQKLHNKEKSKENLAYG